MARVKAAPTKDDVLLAMLLSGMTVHDAAKASDMSERTAWRRMKDPEFTDRLRRAREDTVRTVTDRLGQAAGKAVQVLLAIAEDETAPVAARVSAAGRLLEQALRVGATGEREASEQVRRDLADRFAAYLAGVTDGRAAATVQNDHGE